MSTPHTTKVHIRIGYDSEGNPSTTAVSEHDIHVLGTTLDDGDVDFDQPHTDYVLEVTGLLPASAPPAVDLSQPDAPAAVDLAKADIPAA